MKRIKAFPYVFFHSLASISYYKDILKTRPSFSLKYFAALAFLATVVVSLTTSIKVTPLAKATAEKAVLQFRQMYPDDLIITAKNDEWEINKSEPFVLSFPMFAESKDFPKNFITFYHEGTIEDLQALNTLVLINSKNILVKGNNRLEVYPIKDIPDGEFTKQRLNQALDNLQSVLKVIQLGLFIFMSIMLFIYNFGFRLIYLVIIGMYVWVLSHLVNSKLRFGDAYRIGMHTITLPLMIELMIITAGIKFNAPMWFMFLQLIQSSVIILALAHNKSEIDKE